jgi:release factor glutamine methyltransferase
MSSTIRQLLSGAQRQLAAALELAPEEARIEAQMLLRRALGDVSRAKLIAYDNEIPPSVQAETFMDLLHRRLRGEPIAYILGEREFYGLNLSVTPDVLIPRPDTETLVEAALAQIPQNKPCRVLDMGTGSGAITIAIAAQRPQAQVTGIDRSASAVQIASENARRLQIGNVDFKVSDWFSAIGETVYDIIVSNPPYIAAGDPHLVQGDLRFEPPTALASGVDGLDDIRHLVGVAPRHLASGGWLMLEHGYDQAPSVAQLLIDAGFGEVASVADLGGVLRVTIGKMPQNYRISM